MTDSLAQRRIALTWGTVCLVLFAAIAGLVAATWQPLLDLDRAFGAGPQEYTATHEWARQFFLAVQYSFEFWPMTAFTVVTAVLLFARNHRRAAIWTVGVMTTATLAVTALKPVIERKRPVFDDPVTILKSFSFPSGHACSIASAAGVAIVLALMLVRRRELRRVIIVAAIAVAFLVGADRILLGVHNLSDVVGGWLLGAAITLYWLAFFDPKPRSIVHTTEALPEVFPSEERLLAVVLNPAKIDDPGQFVAMLEEMATESGWSKVSWYQTTVEDPGVGQAHAAAVAGADLVIACGGDGTVRTVSEELAGTGIPVGIVPAGTGNLLARNLALPLYLRAAVDIALNGQDRAIDLVRVSGDKMEDSTFLVMAGMGFDAAIMEGVSDNIKARVGWLAYVLSALKSLMFPAVRIEISLDGAPPTKHRARTVVIGNVGFLQAGLPLIPDAQIDDGELDVVLLYPRWFLSWLPLAVRVLSRNKRTDELITRMRGRQVSVRAAIESPRQLDGDLIEPGHEIRAECLHGRLLVRVPR